MIYLIRHGEAEGNLYRRIQGQYNSDITVLGKKQIRAVVERFRDVKLDAIFSSDLKRAMKTAMAIAESHNMDVMPSVLLREINMGIWENKSWGNLAIEYPEQMYNFVHNIEEFLIDGAEDIATVRNRLHVAILDIARSQKKTIAVISHGTAINAFLSLELKLPFEVFKKKYGSGDNTCVSLLTIDNDKVSIQYCNDSIHLVDEISTYARQQHWRKSNTQMDGVYFKNIPEHENFVGAYAMKGEEIVGQIIGYYVDKIMHIDFCEVGNSHQGQRIGMQLIGHISSEAIRLQCDAMCVRLDDNNKGIIPFFQKAGFILEADLIMVKHISS